MKKDIIEYDFYTEPNSIEPASYDNVKIIKEILKKQNIDKQIKLNFDIQNLSISIDSITQFHVFNKIRNFKLNNKGPVIKYKEKQIDMYMYIGAWSNNPRIKNSHISIYTTSSEVGGERFCQIELSDCVEDREYVYILKNISNLAGNGAISRLNKYSLPIEDKEQRNEDLLNRRKELVDRLHSEVITYNKKDWICIYKFDKNKLYNSSYHKELLYECLISIIKYAFTIESIILEAKEYGRFKPISKDESYISKLPNDVIKVRANKSKNIPIATKTTQDVYSRDKYVVEYAKRRANGICQLCKCKAPFNDKYDNPYLEVHHIKWLSKGGEDSVENTIALCPNCHRRMHILDDHKDVEYLRKSNLIEYIKLSEVPGDMGGCYYTLKVYNDGKVVVDNIDEREEHINKVNSNIVDMLVNEIDDFGFRDFQLKEIDWCTCHPRFCIEVSYIDGSKNEVDFDYGSKYENINGNNGKSIEELKVKIKEILGIKMYEPY